MSLPEYLSSFDELNYQRNDIYTNTTSQDHDTENTYFVSNTLEFETSMIGCKIRGATMVIVTKRSTANYSIYFQCDRGGTYRTKKNIDKKHRYQKNRLSHLKASIHRQMIVGLYVGSGLKPKPKYHEPKTQETEPMGLEVGFKHGVNIQMCTQIICFMY
ncbi:hypothetical protein LXL04_002415 [Taraxacum kok-saghyz]